MVQQKSEGQEVDKQAAALAVYDVILTVTAKAAYQRYFDAAQKAVDRGDITSAHCTALRQIDEVIETIIPHDPFSSRYALAGNLKSMYRYRKGRMRICWIGSAEKRRVVVLFISETLRKAGDSNDPYRILTKMVKDGTYNDFIKQLGIQPLPIAPSYRIQ